MTTEDKEMEVAEALEKMTEGHTDSPKAGDTGAVTTKRGREKKAPKKHEDYLETDEAIKMEQRGGKPQKTTKANVNLPLTLVLTEQGGKPVAEEKKTAVTGADTQNDDVIVDEEATEQGRLHLIFRVRKNY